MDLQSYAAALAQVELIADNDVQVDRYMDEFVDTKVLKWIHMIVARQPDAEFTFAATKADVLKHNVPRVEKVRGDLMRRLSRSVEEWAESIRQILYAEPTMIREEAEEILMGATAEASFFRHLDSCESSEHSAL